MRFHFGEIGAGASLSLNGKIFYKRNGISNLSFCLLVIGLVASMLLSAPTLNQVISYSTLGGKFWEKIHPGSIFIVLSFATVLLPGFLKPSGNRKSEALPLWIIQFLVVWMFCSTYQIATSGVSGIAYLFDTYLVAILAAYLVICCNTKQAFLIYKIAILIVFANSSLALLEYSLKFHIIPGSPFSFSHFRSNSIFGHPLTNALISVSVLFIFLNCNNRIGKNAFRTIFPLIVFCSLLSFGARAAVFIFAGIFSFLYVLNFCKEMVHQGVSAIRSAAFFSAIIFIPAFVLFLIFETSLGSRLASGYMLDDLSSFSRVEALSVFSYFSFNEILYGVDTSAISIFLERNKYIDIIENFWVLLILSFGLLLFVPFSISFLSFLYFGLGGYGLNYVMALILFLLVASSNNSLATKNPALLLFLVTALSAHAASAVSDFREGRPG